MGRKARDCIKRDLYLLLTQSQRLRASTIQKRFTKAEKTSMYKYLKVLLDEGTIIKKGRFPKIYYEAVYDIGDWLIPFPTTNQAPTKPGYGYTCVSGNSELQWKLLVV